MRREGANAQLILQADAALSHTRSPTTTTHSTRMAHRMPRTPESIIDNHHVVNKPRAAGKSVWNRKLTIKQYFKSFDAADVTTRETARRISHTLKHSS
jgi:hypothetical protein